MFCSRNRDSAPGKGVKHVKRITRLTAAALAAAALLATAPVHADDVALTDSGLAPPGDGPAPAVADAPPPVDYGWKKLFDYGLCAMSVAGSLIPPTSGPSMVAAVALCGRLFVDEGSWLPR